MLRLLMMIFLLINSMVYANLENLPAAGDMTFTVSDTLWMEIDADTGVVSATTFQGAFVGDGSGLTNVVGATLPSCTEGQILVMASGVWSCRDEFPANGTSDRNTAFSCKAILDDGFSTGDGTYWLDPDGDSSAISPFQAYCDMTTDGGGIYFLPH